MMQATVAVRHRWIGGLSGLFATPQRLWEMDRL